MPVAKLFETCRGQSRILARVRFKVLESIVKVVAETIEGHLVDCAQAADAEPVSHPSKIIFASNRTKSGVRALRLIQNCHGSV